MSAAGRVRAELEPLGSGERSIEIGAARTDRGRCMVVADVDYLPWSKLGQPVKCSRWSMTLALARGNVCERDRRQHLFRLAPL